MCDKAFDSLTDAKAAELVSMGQRQRSRLACSPEWSPTRTKNTAIWPSTSG